jgi:hypothetical protein
VLAVQRQHQHKATQAVQGKRLMVAVVAAQVKQETQTAQATAATGYQAVLRPRQLPVLAVAAAARVRLLILAVQAAAVTAKTRAMPEQ